MNQTKYEIKKGELLTAYDGQPYDLIDGATWTVESVSAEAETWPGQGRTLWHWVSAKRNRKNGSIGKTQKYFLVSTGGSIRPA